MKRIAVFCTLPPERNTGMATVDLAAYSLLRRIAPEAEITLYSYAKPRKSMYRPGELPYSYVNVVENRERYFSSDIFVFWGDFVHARSYWTVEQAYFEPHLRGASKEELEQWYKATFENVAEYIFLTSLPLTRLKNVIVFGSTIITNDAANETDKNDLDKDYYTYFRTFFTHIGGVYFRDALSAARISQLRANEATLGCDCALLLQDTDLTMLLGYTTPMNRKGVGVFFGRSPSKTKMMIFARLVARHLGETYAWLPWLPSYPSASRRLKAQALGFRDDANEMAPGAVLATLAGCKYIVTDTYHLAVNAWRMGIPAICIGQRTGEVSTSINDRKKELLYEMYGAEGFYVFTESIQSLFSVRDVRRFMDEAKRTASLVQNAVAVSQVCENIAMHRHMAESRLRDALQIALRPD